jgi:outer membrane immunogenic protein
MKKQFCAGLLGLAAVSAAALQANAADMFSGPGGYKDVPYASVTWSGFYVGVNLGYGWSAQSDQLACGPTCSASSVDFGGVSPDGWLGGVQLGYNFQGFGYSPLLIGIETDIQASSIIGQGSDAAGNFYKSRLESLGTVRGRVGYAMDRALLYFTGGLAYGSVDNEALSGNLVSSSNVVTGYTLGGGVEYKFWRDLSVKAEYLYVNLGKNDPLGPPSYSSVGGTVREDAFNTVRVGLNWWPFPAYQPMK